MLICLLLRALKLLTIFVTITIALSLLIVIGLSDVSMITLRRWLLNGLIRTSQHVTDLSRQPTTIKAKPLPHGTYLEEGALPLELLDMVRSAEHEGKVYVFDVTSHSGSARPVDSY